MKSSLTKIDVEFGFVLNKREVEVLHQLTSYSNKSYVESLASKAYEGATKEELLEILTNLQQVTGSLMAKYKQVQVFRG
jgi:hypothetical protein